MEATKAGEMASNVKITMKIAENSESISEIKDNNTNLPDWVVSIWKEREANPAKNIIGKVPQILRKVTSNEACFDPEVLSLGPYHYGKPHLKRLEKYKHKAVWIYTNSDADLTKAEPFYDALRGVVDQVTMCYEKNNEISSSKNNNEISEDEFVWMMLMDGCFVLEFISEVLGKKKMSLSEHDKSLVVRDMMLLENQLPFLVLKTLTVTKEAARKGRRRERRWLVDQFDAPTQRKLADKSVGPVGDQLLSIINQFTDILIQTPHYPSPSLISSHKDEDKPSGKGGDVNEEARKANDGEGDGNDNEPVHLLDSFRTKLLGKKSTHQETESGGHSWYSFRSATELKAAGIKFSRSETTKLSDVRFKSHYFWGELFLPPIVVDDSTKHKLLNTIAYELCPDGPCDYGVSSYLCLLDSLIDREEDVKELRSEGIVLNALGSDQDVAELFNVLAKDLTLDSQAYAQVKKGIESHCKGRWNVNMANLYYTHFDTPWTLVATIAAVFLLILTVIQTYFAIYPRGN
ncbi:UPF0481 protein At3g47200-like isoform X2 [Tasmannia lanceolata]|uniref:UPF0481 protein At3g47200-like isoform X2 n=1 Tax=Tasmannia lanceolata TaxID=3420 RepID=UPI0040636028